MALRVHWAPDHASPEVPESKSPPPPLLLLLRRWWLLSRYSRSSQMIVIILSRYLIPSRSRCRCRRRRWPLTGLQLCPPRKAFLVESVARVIDAPPLHKLGDLAAHAKVGQEHSRWERG